MPPNPGNWYWYCDECQRSFNTKFAPFDHLRRSAKHAWCEGTSGILSKKEDQGAGNTAACDLEL